MPLASAQEDSDNAIDALVQVLGQVDDPGFHLDVLKGINEALKGRRRLAMPKGWPDVYKKLARSPNQQVREQARALALVFGDPAALQSLKDTLANTKAPLPARRSALESLVNVKAKGLAPLLHKLVADRDHRAMREPAITALAAYDDPKTPDVLLKVYKSLALAERKAALGTLASRVAYAKRLLDAVRDGVVPRIDLRADLIRALRLLDDKSVTAAVAKLWGTIRDTPADKIKKIAAFKKMLTADSALKPDVPHGRAWFTAICFQCHTLYGVGGKIGPDLTGSNRANLDYILQNVVDPNALIGKDYQATEIRTDDRRVILGILEREDNAAVTLKTTSGSVIVPKDEIVTRRLSDKSMMPEGLLEALKPQQVRDLVAYLATTRQTPILATEANAVGLFNGQDLSNWDGDEKHWSVEKGEIVGRSSGLKEYKYLISDMLVADFDLKLKVKLVGGAGNSGVFFRASVGADGNVNGYQADAGQGWWGKLVESGGRGTISDKPAPLVRRGDWNTYQIKAVGQHIQTWLNGKPCVDLTDPKAPKRGHLALQLHVGEAMEVRFKDVELRVISAE